MKNLELTWLGHSTFLLDTPGGKRVLIDPWVMGNPACPDAYKSLDKLDLMLITHGHFDHIGDAVELARRTEAQVVAIFETYLWLAGKGVKTGMGMNKGGKVPVQGIQVRMVDARHSCGIQDGDQVIYGGEACGFVLTLEDGLKVYHAGDTALFGDMQLIGERYAPDIALLPIGDLYTMDPSDAARAVELIGARRVVPMHHSTFEGLPGKPADFVAAVGGKAEVTVLQPGQTQAFAPAVAAAR
ncbi:MAG: metal-dependent hydrolase [Candidatus Sericytochromatia bacterium]|nr:metal-dependent hydrolase [Candidatus Tanganyikabacteria bacterium]